MEWETVIGIEVHVRLKTQSKIFSGAATAYGAKANTQACSVDLAFPGVLPVLNKDTVALAVRFGAAIDANIAQLSVFARKNYFYPDLPKGYQISQFEHPIVGKGHLNIRLEDGSSKDIGITRAHLEEDAGKSMHENMNGSTGIDLNRAGIPLLEIVSEPDIRSSAEAIAYLKMLHNLVRYIDICDGNMQEGSFKADINISLRPKGQAELGTRAEIKNLNSFRFIEKAIAFEFERQKEILEGGGRVIQETRLYNPDKDETRSMRSKEEANDYRYFPDPDLLPVEISKQYIEDIRKQLPELPWDRCNRFKKDYGLKEHDAEMLTHDLDTALYFETAVKVDEKISPKMVANWINGDLTAILNKENKSINEAPVTALKLGELLLRVSDQTISRDIAKKVFEAMWQGEGSADEIIEKQGLKQISDSGAIEKIVDEVIQNNPTQVEQFRAGKEKLIAFFVGQVMKVSKGKANPAAVNELLLKKLKL